jgi:hypothetical protein
MAYVDFDRIQKKFELFWNHEYFGRCALSLTAPKKKIDFSLEDREEDRVKIWTDGETILKRRRKQCDNTYFLGEAFPALVPYLGAAGHAAYFNNLRYQFADTVWFFPLEKEEDLKFSKDSYFYKTQLSLAAYLAGESGGDFIISMPDTSGNLDALAHLRGTEKLMMDMLDKPEKVKADLRLIQGAWKEIITDFYALVKENNRGGSCVGWMGTYAPGLHAQMQSDISVMLSPRLFDEFVFDELAEQSAFLEYPVYHLDGAEQQRHLDKLLSLEKLRMIQYTFVAGQPAPDEQIDVLKKIQKSGKLLLLIMDPRYVKPILENLSAKGLFIETWAADPGQADNLFKLAGDYSRG